MESPFLQAHGLLRYIGLFLSGICHQLPEHSLVFAGAQAPLCARCNGMYLGILLGFGNLWLRGRGRASRLPPLNVMVMLAVLVALWVIDGLNSYYHFLTGAVLLYPPHNVLRLATGVSIGLTLSLVVFPLFSFTMWRQPDRTRVVTNLSELTALLLQALALVIVAGTPIRALFYPLILVDTLSVLLMLTIVNSVIVVVLLHREHHATRWRQIALPTVLGLLLSVIQVGGIAWLRYWLGTVLLTPAL